MRQIFTKDSNHSYKLIFISVLLIIGLFSTTIILGKTTNTPTNPDLKILKSEVTKTAKFYPYKSGNTYMEVIAVKASDGSIRTALNTCQVCFDSGRGFYLQEGDELVCQNCGNRFKIDKVEVIKGGCNPVPILKENKTDDGRNIIISKEFLTKNQFYFKNWKRN